MKSRLPSSSSPATACGNNVGDGVRESDVYSVVVGDLSSLPVLFSRHLPAGAAAPSFPSPALAAVSGGGGVPPVAGSGVGRSQGPPSLRGSRDFRLFFRRLVILLEDALLLTHTCNKTKKLVNEIFYYIYQEKTNKDVIQNNFFKGENEQCRKD